MQGFHPIVRTFRFSRLFAVTAIVLAATYFSFQAELFEEEYEAAHPRVDSGWTIGSPTITWETFDNDNAVAAFVIVVDHAVRPLLRLDTETPPPFVAVPDFSPVRDKSPPLS